MFRRGMSYTHVCMRFLCVEVKRPERFAPVHARTHTGSGVGLEGLTPFRMGYWVYHLRNISKLKRP